MKNTNQMPFGYKENGEPDPIQSEIVKYSYEKVIEYKDNPPQVLVDEVIESHKETYGEVLSYDEAKEKVSLAQIEKLVAKEINEKWKDYFASCNKQEDDEELGEWIEGGDWLLFCSKCDREIEDHDDGEYPAFCPWCGKKMKKEIRRY